MDKRSIAGDLSFATVGREREADGETAAAALFAGIIDVAAAPAFAGRWRR